MALVPETRRSLLLKLRDSRDQAAWREFLELYEPLIGRLIRRRGIPASDVDEVAQEVLLAVAGAIPRWECDPQRGSFRGWLATIVRNLVINFLIRQARRPRARGGDADFQDWLIAAPEGEISAEFDLEHQRQTFRWAADRVRHEFRESTWLAFWATAVEDRPVEDVARQLGVTRGVVYVSRSRVMKRLREVVDMVKRHEDPR